ncbi:MAG TPA: hypothetical protein VK892_19435 [Pyrinomonadaceae bacterium]|nr:hypothetical protein [Pyrinomonadaceae bacterium]
MKIKLLLCLLFIFAFSSVSFAQSVKVTPGKITYKRPKPIVDFKKSFTVIYPKISGLTPALNKKVETAVSYERNFHFNLKEEINEIQWLEEASYKVDYNKNGILGVTLTMSGTGAYPSVYDKPVIVNLKNGNKIQPADVFIKLNELAAKAKKAQQNEIKKALIEIKKEYPDEESPVDFFQNADFTAENLKEFTVSDKGVTFWYDYGFPHVAQALQPEGRYFFSWAELKPFIKRGGLLAQFVR